MYAQRIAPSPLESVNDEGAPRRKVNPGPLTLRTTTASLRATRLVICPQTAMPPVSYTPFVTHTIRPATFVTEMADWISFAAVAHESKGKAGAGLSQFTKVVG